MRYVYLFLACAAVFLLGWIARDVRLPAESLIRLPVLIEMENPAMLLMRDYAGRPGDTIKITVSNSRTGHILVESYTLLGP